MAWPTVLLISLIVVVNAILFILFRKNKRSPFQMGDESEDRTVKHVGKTDIEEARREFQRILDSGDASVQVTPATVRARAIPAGFAATFSEVVAKYDAITVGKYETVGIASFGKSPVVPGFIVIGGDPAICEYAVKPGDDTIYAHDFELSPGVYEPRFPSIFHWLIEAYATEQEVEGRMAKRKRNSLPSFR